MALARLAIQRGLDQRRELVEGCNECVGGCVGGHAAPGPWRHRQRRELDRSREHRIGPRCAIETEGGEVGDPLADHRARARELDTRRRGARVIELDLDRRIAVKADLRGDIEPQPFETAGNDRVPLDELAAQIIFAKLQLDRACT